MPHTDSQEVVSIAAQPVDFHEESETFRTEFDYQTRLPSEAIVVAVAEAKDEDMTTLPPLFDRIDTDALDTVFSATSNRTYPSEGSVTFDYVDCQITVNSYGTVVVDPSEESAKEDGR